MPRGRKKTVPVDGQESTVDNAPKKKKEKEPKFYEAEPVEQMVEKLLKDCPDMFNSFSMADVKCLFKNVKEKSGKNIWVKIVKEPISLLTNKKFMIIVGADWWSNNLQEDILKAMIEAMIGITTDDEGKIVQKDYDVLTYSELLKDAKLDYSKFSKVLPTAAVSNKPADLKLTHPE